MCGSNGNYLFAFGNSYEMAGMSNYIGKEIWVKTTNGDEYSGELFCYEITDSNSIIIREKTDEGKVNYVWLKTSVVREVRALRPDGEQPQTPDNELGVLPPLTVQHLEEAERKGEEYFSSIKETFGVGVHQDGQDMFDELSRTAPCKWSQHDIKCYSVTISPNYLPETCHGGANEAELSRVRTMVQKIRTKLSNRRGVSRFSSTSSDITGEA